MDEVERLHEHESAVIAPAVFLAVAFPFGVTIHLHVLVSLAFSSRCAAPDVEIGHGEVEASVWSAEDVRITNTMLNGDGVAIDDGLVVVQCRPRVRVVAESHVEAVISILVINHEIGALVRLLGMRAHHCQEGKGKD